MLPFQSDERHNCEKVRLVHDYTKWILTNEKARAIASEEYFAVVPDFVTEHLIKELKKMECNSLAIENFTAATAIAGAGSSLQGQLQVRILIPLGNISSSSA